MAFVQQIDLVLGLDQLSRLLTDLHDTQNGPINALKFSIGIKDDASIKIEAVAVKWDSSTGRMPEISKKPEGLCPVPPDCPHTAGCKERVNSHFDASFTTETLSNSLK